MERNYCCGDLNFYLLLVHFLPLVVLFIVHFRGCLVGDFTLLLTVAFPAAIFVYVRMKTQINIIVRHNLG